MKRYQGWKLWIAISTLFITILIATTLPLYGLSREIMAMIGVTILALVYWSTECIPIPLTGIAIILLIVIFGILPMSEALSYIASDVNILILAGLIIAVALAKHEVDRYLSLKLLYYMGEKTDRLILGMMLSTALISMWIPNTAAAAIMAPVAAKMLNLLNVEKGKSNLGKAMMIGVAYAASIGGIGTPVGTPPVPITIKNVKEATGLDIGFATWMTWGVPLLLILTFTTWITLTGIYRPEVGRVIGGRRIVEAELASMGGLNTTRLKTLVLFLLAVALWLLDPLLSIYIRGWTYVASMIIIILLVFPGIGVLEWRDVSRETDWGTLFLVAGGLALGGGLRKTGLVDIMADNIKSLITGLHPYVMIYIMGLVSSLAVILFCSITATSAAMVPVAIAVARALNIHPLIAAVTSGIASCFAFMLPANTPPNAIAYSYGYFKSYEMARIGVVLIPLSIAISMVFILLIVPSITGVAIAP